MNFEQNDRRELGYNVGDIVRFKSKVKSDDVYVGRITKVNDKEEWVQIENATKKGSGSFSKRTFKKVPYFNILGY